MSQLKPADLIQQFKQELENAQTQEEILKLSADYSAKIKDYSQNMRNLSPEERKVLGAEINQVKNAVEELRKEKLLRLEEERIFQRLKEERIDFTDRQSTRILDSRCGGYHPVTLVQREIEDIFLSMGFSILDGPHVDDDYHNFQALNIPADHPARDMQDTFWFADGVHLLRTQTSTIQVRGMEKHRPPFKFIAPGKVFRAERTDASHEMCFHQLEGMLVDKDLSVANLIYFMKTILEKIFKRVVEVRLRPGYFPFVEPGFELDMRCLICAGKGCSVCKQVGWLEVLPCGMVHPNVLRYGNIDPEEYRGMAFCIGLDRLVMMRYAINDVRLMHSGDLRFLQQFSII